MNFFQNMLSSIMKSRLAFSRSGAEDFGFFHKEINKATESVMSTTGEVSSIAFAEHLLDLIENQDEEELINFLYHLLKEYDIDTESLSENIKAYESDKNQRNLGLITDTS